MSRANKLRQLLKQDMFVAPGAYLEVVVTREA